VRFPAARGPRRFLEILLLAGFIAVVAITVSQLNLLLSRKMEVLKERSIAALQSRLGHEIRYRSIAPSVLGFLAMRDLTVFSVRDPERPLLRISRVKIYYNLFRLLSTREPLQSLSEIQLANSSFEVERERDQELLEFLEHLRTGGGSELPSLRLTGSNIRLRYRDSGWSAAVRDLFFSIESVEEHYRISIRGLLEYRHGESESPALSTRVQVTGKVERSLAWSDLAVRVFSLSTSALSLRRQTFQVTYSGQELKVNKIQDRAPLDVQLIYNRLSGELAGSFTMEKLRPADLVSLGGPLERYNQWLASSLTASGTFTYNFAAGTLRYQADAELLPAEQLVPVDLYLVSHLHGTEKTLYLEPVVVHSPQGTLEFSGDVRLADRLPSGLLRLTEVRSPYTPALSASLEVAREPGRVTVRGSRLQMGEVTLSDFSLALSPTRGEIPFQLAATLASESGGVQASGALSLGPRPALRLETQARGLPLDVLYYLVAAGAIRGGPLSARLAPLSGAFDLSLATDFRTFSLSSGDIRFYQRALPSNFASFALLATEEEVELRGLRAQWNGYALSGQAEARRTGGGLEFASELLFENIPYSLHGTYSAGRHLRLEGSYGLSAVVAFGAEAGLELIPSQARTPRGTSFSLQARRLPVPLKKGKVLLSTEIQGLLTRSGTLFARSPLTRVEDLSFLAVKENSLELGFSLADGLLSMDSIRYQDRYSTVAGQGSLTLDGWRVAEGWVRLQDREGSERYSLAIGRSADGPALLLDFNRTPLERTGELAVSGDVSGSLRFQGSLQDPDISVRLQLADGRLNADPLTAELAASYRDHRLSLENLSLGLLTHRLSEGRGYWDLALGELDFNARYAADLLGKPTRLALELKGTTAPAAAGGGALSRDPATAASTIPPGTPAGLLERDLDAVVRLTGIQVERRDYPDWIVRLRARGGELRLDGGPQEAIHATIARSGQFSLGLEAPLPIQANATGNLLRDRIEARFDVVAVDLRIINTLLAPSTDLIQFTAGTGAGALRIAGMVTDPDWFGTLAVHDAAMRFKYSPEEIRPINGRLDFNEKTFSLPRVTSQAGRTRVEAEGSFSLDHWIPRGFELAFYIDDYPGAHFKATFAPVSLDGYATGAVRVRGDSVDTWVEGKITANLCRIALVRSEEEAPVSTRSAAPLSIDLKIAVGRGVEFFWPAQTFPVVHTYAKQGEQVAVTLDGETGMVALAGDVEIRGGEIFYFDRSFYLKRGSIRFDTGLGEVDPWIKALAEIRERDQNNEEIKIYLEADNKLSQFSPRFYSDPVRADLDIMGLIGGNIVDRFQESSFGLSAVMLTSDIVGQFGILSPFERAVRRLLNLDLFSIRTQFLQNILVGKLMEGSGVTTFNPLDNTTLSLGKYLGTDLFVQALVRFQATDAVGSAYNIQTEGELNLEWTTPFFLLEWTFAPRHPENLFLSDNSIGFSWKFSY
jgi:translocation and assembly module TamB